MLSVTQPEQDNERRGDWWGPASYRMSHDICVPSNKIILGNVIGKGRNMEQRMAWKLAGIIFCLRRMSLGKYEI